MYTHSTHIVVWRVTWFVGYFVWNDKQKLCICLYICIWRRHTQSVDFWCSQPIQFIILFLLATRNNNVKSDNNNNQISYAINHSSIHSIRLCANKILSSSELFCNTFHWLIYYSEYFESWGLTIYAFTPVEQNDRPNDYSLFK